MTIPFKEKAYVAVRTLISVIAPGSICTSSKIRKASSVSSSRMRRSIPGTSQTQITNFDLLLPDDHSLDILQDVTLAGPTRESEGESGATSVMMVTSGGQLKRIGGRYTPTPRAV